jgi:hypothetical protein
MTTIARSIGRLGVAGTLAAVGLALLAAAPAAAVPPLHDRFTIHVVDVDTETCSFPVVREFDFTNRITEFPDDAGLPAKLQLHQSTVGTLTANGTTLRLNIRETIMVEFVDGIPVRAKHVGQLDYIGGSHGQPVFHRTGQAVFEVVGGLDGPLIARHGLRADFDPVAFCASFS